MNELPAKCHDYRMNHIQVIFGQVSKHTKRQFALLG